MLSHCKDMPFVYIIICSLEVSDFNIRYSPVLVKCDKDSSVSGLNSNSL